MNLSNKHNYARRNRQDYSKNCVRRHSKVAFECSRTLINASHLSQQILPDLTKRESVHLKTVKPFSNGATHNYTCLLANKTKLCFCYMCHV